MQDMHILYLVNQNPGYRTVSYIASNPFFLVLNQQAVCKLPFIKESRLLAEIAKVEHSLTVIIILEFVNGY